MPQVHPSQTVDPPHVINEQKPFTDGRIVFVGGKVRRDPLHFPDVGGVLARIGAGQCMPSTKRAIRFTARTASRQVEVRRATRGPFDLEPALRLKSTNPDYGDHTVLACDAHIVGKVLWTVRKV